MEFLAFPAHSRLADTAIAGTGNSGCECARRFEPCVSGRTLGALANRRARASPKFAADQSQPSLGRGWSHCNGLGGFAGAPQTRAGVSGAAGESCGCRLRGRPRGHSESGEGTSPVRTRAALRGTLRGERAALGPPRLCLGATSSICHLPRFWALMIYRRLGAPN